MQTHPAQRLLEQGVAVTISTDARTTADTTLNREFDALARTFGWVEQNTTPSRITPGAQLSTHGRVPQKGEPIPDRPHRSRKAWECRELRVRVSA
jgi:hypothetical protein